MKPSKQPNRLSVFAVTAPGLEPICAAELRPLGIRGTIEEGGGAWKGDLESVARGNLWLRTASRVLVRVAEFTAKAFFELELHAKQIPWDRFVSPGSKVDFRVTCRKSKLYHSDAVAQRLAQALQRRVANVQLVDSSDAGDENAAESDHQLFVVRFVRDVCAVSADTSGALLHFRGYRQELAKAPLRETLAAAVLLGAGWSGDTPLTDPMCGSGTIPIEGALISRRMAPGRARTFAFLRWPYADKKMWDAVLESARAGELPSSPVEIVGADRDAGAIAASRANAERAGVAADIVFVKQSIRAHRGGDTRACRRESPVRSTGRRHGGSQGSLCAARERDAKAPFRLDARFAVSGSSARATNEVAARGTLPNEERRYSGAPRYCTHALT